MKVSQSLNRSIVSMISYWFIFGGALATVVGQDSANPDTAGQNPVVEEATADDELSREALIKELDEFRDSLFQAFNKGDYPQMLEDHCHPDVIATWQDGTSSQGFDAVLAQFDHLSEFIDAMQVAPLTDLRLVLNDGNLVVASGPMSDTYKMANGADIALESRWSATVIRQDGQWRLISFAAATDGFDNEVIDMFMRMRTVLTASIAVVVGLIVGVVIGKLLGGRSRTA